MRAIGTYLRSARTSLLAAAIVLSICVPILVWATNHYEALLIAERRQAVAQQLELRSRALSYNFARVAGTLDAMVAVATKNEHFETLAQGLRANLPWVRAFQLVEDGTITQVFPVAGNEASVGYRLLDDPRPVIGGDVLRALDTGRITITGPIALVQGGLGLIVRKPFERTGTAHGRLAAVVCNASDLLRESLLGHAELRDEGLDLALRVAGREPFWGKAAVFSGDPVVVRVPMADDLWELAARPTSDWAAEVAQPIRWFLFAGLIITALLTLLGALLARSHTSLTRTVSQRDREIQSQHSLLRAVVDGARDAIFIKDLEGHYLMVNEACAQLFERTESEVVGKKDAELLDPGDVEGVVASDARVRETGLPYSYEETLTFDGARRTFNTVKVPHRDASGAVIGIIGVARDITEAKRAEEALHQAELRTLRQQRLEALGTLAGGIAHDINNALAPIVIAVDALRIDYPTENELLDVVGASARRAAEMVKQLLGFARGREGERVPLQVGLVVSELRGLMSSSFPKNIELVFNLEADLPLIRGDSTQVLQVLTNLCVNARDAMPDGGTLRVQTRRATVDAAFAAQYVGAKEGEHVVISVSDTGHGIPAEVLDRIYEPFFSTKGHAKGTGLGLSTALGFVRGHDGFMVTESTPQVGTTVSVFLPVATNSVTPATPIVAGPAVRAPASGPEVRGSGEPLLFVDDEPQILEVVSAALTRLGYRVLTAPSAEAALRLVDEHGRELRAVITDIHMPRVDGIALLRAIAERLPALPLGVVSGGLSEREAQTLIELGLGRDHRLDKPFSDKDLAALVARLVHASAATTTPGPVSPP